MPSVLLEACVETLEAALAAEAGGAGRIELCTSLDVGGLTPAINLVAACAAELEIAIFVMVRLRPGGFVLSTSDVEAMTEHIGSLREAGAAGFVLGALTGTGDVDAPGMARLLAAARGAPITFHRAFDEVRDPLPALEVLVALGVTRVLTAGGTGSAVEGADRIAALVRQAAGRVTIVAGGGVRAHNAAALVARTGVTEIHSRTPEDQNEVARLLRAANQA